MIFAPLAFGGVEPWAVSVLAVLAYTGLALAVGRYAFVRRSRGIGTPVLIPAGLALLLVGVQLVHWPVGLLTKLSPLAVHLHQAAASSVGMAHPEAVTPSLCPHATREALIRLSAYVALFIAACGYVRSRAQMTRLAGSIVAIGFGVSLLGIVQKLSGTHRIYWWRELTQGGSPFGTFVSRNQFAAYAGVCLCVGVALLLGRVAHGGRSGDEDGKSLRSKLSERAPQNFLVGFAIALVGAAILWSLSRGGIVALVLAFAGVFFAIGLAGVGKKRRFYLAAVVVVALGWITYLGWAPVLERLGTLDEMAGNPKATWRWQMCGDAWRMGLDFPWLGSGAGAFHSVYPLYRTIPTRARAFSPHDEYMHVLSETGFTGLLFLAGGILMTGLTVVRGLIRRRNRYMRGFLAGGVGILLVISLHSIVDFPMRSPAVAATVAVAAAMLYSATRIEANGRRSESRREDTNRKSVSRSPDGRILDRERGEKPVRMDSGAVRRALVGFLAVAIGWGFACNFALNPLRGQLQARHIARARERLDRGTEGILRFARGARRSIQKHSPLDAGLHAALADFCRAGSAVTTDPLEALRLADQAVELRWNSVRLEPANARHPYELTSDYLDLGRPDLARKQAERACKLRPADPWTRVYLADLFRAYRQAETARHFLQRAQQLADERQVEAVRPLINEARHRLQQATGNE